MHKVYLLLRNNQQKGPYSLEELLQLQLKPFDLVWVEGRSAAWRYPGEIDTLKPYVPETPAPEVPFQPVSTSAMESIPVSKENQNPAKHIYVSYPGKPAGHVSHQETNPKPATSIIDHNETASPYSGPVSYSNDKINTDPVEAFQTKFQKPLPQLEEEYTGWVFQQKAHSRSRITKKDWTIAAILISVILGGFFILTNTSSGITSTNTNSIANQSLSQQPSKQEQADFAVNAPEENLNSKIEKDPSDPKIIDETASGKVNIPAIEKIGSTPVFEIQNEKKQPEDQVQDPDIKSLEVENNNDVLLPGKNEEKLEIEKPRNKKLGEKIKDLFRKKDRAEVGSQDTPPATNRQAQKKNSSEVDALSTDKIFLSTNNPDNWMMGINGLKITLRNRNNVPIQSAVVQVKYYDVNNRLLETKTVTFSNVAADGRVTADAPDHKWAERVELQLGPVTAMDNLYAAQN